MHRLSVSMVMVAIGCGSINKLDGAFNRAEEELGRQGDDWQKTLRDLEAQARQDGKDLLANDIHNLMTQTVAVVGNEFRCNADFVRHRVSTSLQTIWASFRHKPLPPRPAVVCGVTPNVVDLRVHPLAVEFDGYDFDQHMLKATFVPTTGSGAPAGATQDVTARLAHPAPMYQVTLATPEAFLQAPGTLTLASVEGGTSTVISTVSVVRTCPEPPAAAPPKIIAAFSTTDLQVGGLLGSTADRLYGGSCAAGFHHKQFRLLVRSTTGDAHCGDAHWRDDGNPHDCGCYVHWGAAALAGVTCDIVIDQEEDVTPYTPPPGCH